MWQVLESCIRRSATLPRSLKFLSVSQLSLSLALSSLSLFRSLKSLSLSLNSQQAKGGDARAWRAPPWRTHDVPWMLGRGGRPRTCGRCWSRASAGAPPPSPVETSASSISSPLFVIRMRPGLMWVGKRSVGLTTLTGRSLRHQNSASAHLGGAAGGACVR